MKKVYALMVLGLFASFSFTWAGGDVDRQAFYSESIDLRITQCEQKARLIDSQGENLQSCGREAMEQIKFYQSHKQELIRRMLAEDIEAKNHQADYFLIKAYREFKDTQVATR